MTFTEALQQLAEQHRPYLPTVTDVCEDGEWRDATHADQAATLQWWCDGCRTPADVCVAAPILALAGVRM